MHCMKDLGEDSNVRLLLVGGAVGTVRAVIHKEVCLCGAFLSSKAVNVKAVCKTSRDIWSTF